MWEQEGDGVRVRGGKDAYSARVLTISAPTAIRRQRCDGHKSVPAEKWATGAEAVQAAGVTSMAWHLRRGDGGGGGSNSRGGRYSSEAAEEAAVEYPIPRFVS